MIYRLPSGVVLFASALLVFFVSFALPVPLIQAQADHLVISEIQVGGLTANDEFVELYNPTDADINLAGWKLRKKAGDTESPLVASLSGTVASHGYFLITHATGYTGTTAGDQTYSSTSYSISGNNTVILQNDTSTRIDIVGMGTASDFETTAVASPSAGGSIERKAKSGSTNVDMATGGSDELLGNGEDTDNNASDFVLQPVSNPQNSSSLEEFIPSPTASPILTPTLTPTATPTDVSTPSPTDIPPTPTESPTPTDIPTPTPTEAIPPTPTLKSGHWRVIRGPQNIICILRWSSPFRFPLPIPQLYCTRRN